MAVPDLQVTTIKSEGREAWTVFTVEFQWLDGDYQGDGQWPDALEAVARAMESGTWRAYWSRPHFVKCELFDAGLLLVVAMEQPESAMSFSGWSLSQRDG
jgi:hypothetical protein